MQVGKKLVKSGGEFALVKYTNLGQMQRTITIIINFLLKHFNALVANQKHLYEIVKRSFRTILFNLYGTLPLTTWSALLLIEETFLSDYFKKECITLRIKKRTSSAAILKKFPVTCIIRFF